MSLVNELRAEVNQILSYGEQIRFKYYNVSYGAGSYYDDDITLTQSGNDLWCSGVILPIDTTRGSYDSVLLEQGKITLDDKKIYVNGDIQTSGLGPIKIGTTGSPPTRQYEIIDGVTYWNVNGSPIYKKIYVRYLTNGSFIGE